MRSLVVVCLTAALLALASGCMKTWDPFTYRYRYWPEWSLEFIKRFSPPPAPGADERDLSPRTD